MTEKQWEYSKDRIYYERGRLRRFINIYVNGKDIPFPNDLDMELTNRNEVPIIPSLEGG